MRAHHIKLFLILSLFTTFSVQFTRGTVPKIQDLIVEAHNRRILHQPLFPASSAPPPASVSSSPPPPPTNPDFPDPNQPFFPEVPTGPTQDQAQPPPAPVNGTAVPNPIATQPNKPAKKVAIAVSVGIVTLGMLSALAFSLYKHRSKRPGETQKLVGSDSHRFNDESRMPPNTFLYIGTVEPSTQSSVSETNGANASSYHKLSSGKRSDRYRPSPDLQPLPPLSKPPPPPSLNSPPPMSSSDEESHGTAFYTPQGSLVSNEEGTYTPSLRQSHLGNNSGAATRARAETHVIPSVPHSKRNSPKSRISASSPEMKCTITPSIKKPPIPPPPPPPPAVSSQPWPQSHKVSLPTIQHPPSRPTFSAPPQGPDLGRLPSTNNQSQQTYQEHDPPPPPPPPPQLTPRKLGCAETNVRSTPSQSRSFSSQGTCEETRTVEEGNMEPTSSERNDADEDNGSKPKLKPLHWDKVRATSERATVWDQLKSSSFELNEDMMESLFGCNSTNSVQKEATRKSVLPPVEQHNKVLDPRKSQNIAIMLRALNVTRDEVCEALLDGNPEGLGAEVLETLVKMAPTKEEEIKLRDYSGDISKLGSAERFLKAVLNVPFAFTRVEAMLYRANFNTEVKYLRTSFQTLEVASEELKNSRLFLKLLEAVLRTGNRMNVGTNRGDARAFKLDTLLKLVDIKGTDGKTTLLHFVVQEIIRSEGGSSDMANSKLKEDFKKQGLQVVAGLSRELSNIKKAAGMDSDILSSYVSKLAMGLEKVRLVLQYDKPNMQGKFFETMKMFLKEAEEELIRIKAEERKALSLVKEVTEYFHGDAAKEEAHPLRIFMIVRDFLSTLDNVCKEVGRMQESTVVGSARSFRIPASASLPVLNRYNVRQDRSSDDESLSP